MDEQTDRPALACDLTAIETGKRRITRRSRGRIVARWATEVKPRSVAPAYPLTAPAVRPET
jgi:hypothetical protein